MKYETVFWDWNGTILDDLQTGIDSINALFARRNMPLFDSPDDYYRVFTFPIEEYYKRAGFDFSVEPYAGLAVEYMDEYYANCETAKLFPDVADAIEKLNANGVRQIVLSAYEREGLKSLLNRYGISRYFSDVVGLDNIYAASKVGAAKKWAEENSFDMKKAVMIGDTTHDLEAAEAIGCDCVFIARGHNSKADLLKTGAPVFDDADELYEFLNENTGKFERKTR